VTESNKCSQPTLFLPVNESVSPRPDFTRSLASSSQGLWSRDTRSKHEALSTRTARESPTFATRT
jgi:hypothetical protein